MPRYFAVRRVRGPAWDHSKPMRQQALWDDHARFMNALAAEGFVVLGGPIGEGGEDTLLVIDSVGEETLRTRLAADPWTQAGLLEIVRVEPWTILLDSRSS
jgi:uncharacterized protein YciI